MAEIEFDALCEETAAFIDLDPTHWDQEAGSFRWHGHVVFYTKKADSIVLEVEGRTLECGRQ